MQDMSRKHFPLSDCKTSKIVDDKGKTMKCMKVKKGARKGEELFRKVNLFPVRPVEEELKRKRGRNPAGEVLSAEPARGVATGHCQN